MAVASRDGGAKGASMAASRTIAGAATVRGFGRPTVSAGDTNGDGFNDVMLGGTANRVVALYRGAAAGVVLTPGSSPGAPAGTTGFGSAIAGGF